MTLPLPGPLNSESHHGVDSPGVPALSGQVEGIWSVVEGGGGAVERWLDNPWWGLQN